MRAKLWSRTIALPAHHTLSLLAVDTALAILFFFIPNILLGCSFMYVMQVTSTITDPIGCIRNFIRFVQTMNIETLVLWSIANASLGILLLLLRRHVFHPLAGISPHIHRLLQSVHPDSTSKITRSFNIRTTLGNLPHIAHMVQDHAARHHITKVALQQAQEALKKITAHHSTLLQSANREMAAQYQAVLSYANYLEEQVVQHTLPPEVRYDFDEVSESAFNLQLIAGALNLIQQPNHAQCTTLRVPEFIQETMLALSASLDRRCMKLTTLEVDTNVLACSNPAVINHVLWMLLLGTIRYAADESTLRLRCLYSTDRRFALISIIVSELSPGKLTEKDRSAFLTRQLHHLTPHMFAETIRIHANLQLSEILLTPLRAQLSISPLTSHSCEICLKLPTTLS